MRTKIAHIRAGDGVSIEEAVARVQKFMKAGPIGGEDDAPKYPGKSTSKDGITVSARHSTARISFEVTREPEPAEK